MNALVQILADMLGELPTDDEAAKAIVRMALAALFTPTQSQPSEAVTLQNSIEQQ